MDKKKADQQARHKLSPRHSTSARAQRRRIFVIDDNNTVHHGLMLCGREVGE